ncbi:peptide ABC transporter permease [Enterococcus ureilyticus]|uniref:Peptide ABC transporter permease n=1 Tax=Enterococcus ureilyticus TaxID=1131292 RepID=A0A1E5HB22_9ENTE|nr:ABC transporter permease [Enterococcus ureilyticus]MBM7688826.1 putative ABC transport system permease protein [Enterococcus ureilyticus]OEG22026.1 peptide ABC transporter permease [Enterococcus ureilyticus]
MSFSQFVIRNTLRNKHLYMAYFLSTLFSVMVFFTFTVFAFHPSLADGLNDKAQIGMLAAAIIIYGFAFFFVLYSMDVFIQSRKKEFGLLMIQGMSPKQLKKMVFIENLVIGFFATIIGSLAGVGFSQVILWLSNKLMHVSFGFYFPTQALGLTIISFAALFLAISFFIQFRLPKLSLQELLKAGDLGKGTIQSSRVKTMLAIVLIGAGYAIALLVKGMLVPFVMIPVIFLVVAGTRFLFNQLSVSVIERLKKKQAIFWKKTNMVVFSDLAFRMKDNARSFFLVSIISTVAFAAIGTLYGFQNMILDGMKQVPYEFQLTGTAEETAGIKQTFTQLLADRGIQVDEGEATIYTNAEQIDVIKESDYNHLAKLANKPTIQTQGNAVQLRLANEIGIQEVTINEVKLPDEVTLPVTKTEKSAVVSAYATTVIVPDETKLQSLENTITTVWQPKNASYDELVSVGKFQEKNPLLMAKSYSQQTITNEYAPILFVGIFIGIVFFVSAGSFLYFRLYSDMDADVEKFKMIYKMGLAKKELKKMIYQQVGILFFTPIIVSVIHGAVALTAMYHMFNQGMQIAGWQVLGMFIVIQIIYYLIARVFYFKKVYRLVQA